MRFFSLLLFLSFFSCTMRAAEGENGAVRQLFQKAVNTGKFEGVKILLTAFPEYQEEIKRLAAAHDQGRMNVNMDTAQAFYDFQAYLRDLS